MQNTALAPANKKVGIKDRTLLQVLARDFSSININI